MSVVELVALAADSSELVEVAEIVASLPAALIVAYRRRMPATRWYQPYRRALGRGILLWLEQERRVGRSAPARVDARYLRYGQALRRARP